MTCTDETPVCWGSAHTLNLPIHMHRVVPAGALFDGLTLIVTFLWAVETPPQFTTGESQWAIFSGQPFSTGDIFQKGGVGNVTIMNGSVAIGEVQHAGVAHHTVAKGGSDKNEGSSGEDKDGNNQFVDHHGGRQQPAS